MHDFMHPMRLPNAAFFSHNRILCLAVAFTLSARGADDLASLSREVAADPQSAPQLIVRAFHAAGEAAPSRAGVITAAVVSNLGSQPSKGLIGRVVNAAVRTLPDSAVEIVRAAVASAPAEAAETIVASAIAALPDPWKVVMYQAGGIRRTEPDYKGGPEYKGEPDYKGGPDYRSGPGTPMTIAEAIVQAALDSRAGLGATALYAAAEAVLRTAPGWLITAIYDPKGISGVGEAGLNNYANEPFRPRVLAPTVPPVSE